jgi:ADP-ribose pyrophosphatase
MQCDVVFHTAWFQLVEKHVPDWSAPHYSLQLNDYVSVVALTEANQLLLVRQYRPAIEAMTLELPSGHVDAGESPEEAARKELWEETGYRAKQFELLGQLAPDVGRMGNRLWCFFAGDVRPDPAHQPETGIEVVHYEKTIPELLDETEFCHALNLATLLQAVVKRKLSLTT